MKQYFLLLLSFLAIFQSFAQLAGDGYYRVQNKYTGRYIRVRDGYGRVDIASTSADMSAVQTVKPFSAVEADPASIIYIEKKSSGYILHCQGTSTYKIISQYLNLGTSGDAYQTYATKSGTTVYLADKVSTKDTAYLVTDSRTSRDWYIKPVNQDDEKYLGVKPEISYGGKFYTDYYASFPFSLTSSGMNAFYVNHVDDSLGIAVYTKVDNGEIPSGMPIFLECISNVVSDNKLNVHSSNLKAPSENKLKGVYFMRVMKDTINPHNSFVKNDTSTMRVLGITKKGSLGYIKYSGQYMPENSSYLTVPAKTSDDYMLMTKSEYEEYRRKTSLEYVSSSSDNFSTVRKGVYTVIGSFITDDVSSVNNLPAGIYIVDGRKILVR